MIKKSRIWLPGLFFTLLIYGQVVTAAESSSESSSRRIEEVVVYGQRNEATVSDTSIAITAMDQQFLEDMGIQGPNEMINFIPATTRTDWDIKIRGVGRNFRGLGGDPGVGTYYNGIYSPDFGIAATEGGLFDLKRIEVLRGPQGTLYGRNSIGGVLNYVTNSPNHDEMEGQVKIILGEYNTNEWYGVVSGPLTDSLAYRLVGVQRLSDGRVEGLGDSEDIEGIDDHNYVLTLDWEVSDSLSVNFRVNDRYSNRKGNFGNGGHGILSEGPCIGTTPAPITKLSQCDPQYRVARDTNYYVTGLRSVDSDFPGAFPFIHPTTGETFYATYKRPGVDPTIWPYSPSPNYHDPLVAVYDGGNNAKPDFKSLTNNMVNETFQHNSASLILKWDISDSLALHYLGNYQSFDYYFNRDNDFSSSEISSMGDTVLEGVFSYSHELRFFWDFGERWTATTGLYYFLEDRDQHYGIRNRFGKGYASDATIYGPPGNENWVRNAFPWMPDCFAWQTAVVGAAGGFGAFCGDQGIQNSPSNDSTVGDTGAVYEHDNNVVTRNIAFYTQGDLMINDQFSVTLGIRYSKDTRDALEARGGYSEIEFTSPAWDWVPFVFAPTAPEGFDTDQFFAPGVTPLAALNVALGAATFTGDPDNPIAPVCPLEAVTCANPLRLGGLPISWGSRAAGKYETDNWSYRVNFNWTPNDDMLIYFGTTTSYRAGGFNMGGTDNRVEIDTTGDGGNDSTVLLFFDDEELISWELGYKGTHFNSRLQVTAALYIYDYEDYQDHVERWETNSSDFDLPAGLPSPSGRGPVEATVNIPDASNEGFEVDGLWLATDALTLGGNYSYTISEWDSSFTLFNENDPRYPREILGGDVSQDPCSLPADVKALYCLEADGIQLSGIPKHKATAWGSYRWPLNAGTLTVYASVAYTGDYFTSAFARPWDEVPERYRTDVRISFLSSDSRWNASLFIDNLFDDTYLRWSDMDRRRTGYGSNFAQRVVALSPRFVGVEFVYNFGT